MMALREIVKQLPYPMQQSVRYSYSLIPPRIRYGRVFWETYNFLQKSQWWSKERLEEFQMLQLNKLLNHAYENVPYYRRILMKGLPKDIKDLRLTSYFDKEIIRNLSDLVPKLS